MKTQGIYDMNFNFTTEDRNDEAMFSETIPSILLRAPLMTVHGVRSTGKVGRRKAKATQLGKVC